MKKRGGYGRVVELHQAVRRPRRPQPRPMPAAGLLARPRAPPPVEIALELRRPPHYKARFEGAELLGREQHGPGRAGTRVDAPYLRLRHAQPRQRADVRETAGKIIDPARHQRPLGGIRKHREQGQQIFAGRELVQVQNLFRSQVFFNLRERLRLGLQDQVESSGDQQARRQQPEKDCRRPCARAHPGQGRPSTFGGGAARYCQPAPSCNCCKRNCTPSSDDSTRAIMALALP